MSANHCNYIHAPKNMCQCNGCGKPFSNYNNLRKHVKRFHKDQVDELAPKKVGGKRKTANVNYKYQCELCSKNFNHAHHLTFHMKNHGIVGNSQSKKNKKCPLCEHEAPSKEDLIKHFHQSHNITIETEVIKFESTDEYSKWKNGVEASTKSKFVKEYQSFSKNNKTISLICHRTGNYIPEGTSQRRLKIQGSNKINAHCPASMKVTTNQANKSIKVTFTKTHVGHQEDLAHLYLTSKEREYIATKIASKIPFSSILDEIRDSVSNSELERFHLLNKKDLYNIKTSFNLNSTSVRHKNDCVSVDSWPKEMQEHGTVLFYKPQDEILPQYPQLKKEDFFLVIMTEAQSEILLKYCSDCICIDGTHGINGHGFELNTLLVIDDMRQGFPCAFLISNRSDETVLRIFFSCIKDKVGNIAPKVLMSDMSEDFYNAWKEIMSPPQLRLYCSWDVDRAWRKNLTKISCEEKQVEVYKSLRTLMQETDIFTFKVMLEEFITQLATDSENQFLEYFNNYYVKKEECWAYCYRTGAGMNTNIHIECMHRTLKYIYLNGKNVKRLDKALHAIMKFVRDKLFDILIVKHKGKLCGKIKELRKCHKDSKNMDCTSIIQCGKTWEIQSFSKDFEYYTIEENINGCTCTIICSECACCIHKYKCSCLDSSIRWNMCKHIHLLCQHLKTTTTEMRPHSAGDDEALFIHEDPNTAECIPILKEMSKSYNETCIDEERIKLKQMFNCMVDGAESLKDLNTIKEMITPILSILAARKSIITHALHFKKRASK